MSESEESYLRQKVMLLLYTSPKQRWKRIIKRFIGCVSAERQVMGFRL